MNVRHILMIPKVSSDDLLKARMRLDSIAQEIRSGKITFADAARQYSDGTSKAQGGIVTNEMTSSSRFTKEEISEQFPGVSVVGVDVGTVTNALSFKTDNQRDAYRIVRLDKRFPEHKANLTDDYDRISNAALQEKKDKKIMDWSAKMIKNTYIRIADEYKGCTFRLNWTGK